MTLIGYARVSTAEQNLGLQKDALTKACCGPCSLQPPARRPTSPGRITSCRSTLQPPETLPADTAATPIL
jgi:Resolvase, N terminal domain